MHMSRILMLLLTCEYCSGLFTRTRNIRDWLKRHEKAFYYYLRRQLIFKLPHIFFVLSLFCFWTTFYRFS